MVVLTAVDDDDDEFVAHSGQRDAGLRLRSVVVKSIRRFDRFSMHRDSRKLYGYVSS